MLLALVYITAWRFSSGAERRPQRAAPSRRNAAPSRRQDPAIDLGPGGRTQAGDGAVRRRERVGWSWRGGSTPRSGTRSSIASSRSTPRGMASPRRMVVRGRSRPGSLGAAWRMPIASSWAFAARVRLSRSRSVAPESGSWRSSATSSSRINRSRLTRSSPTECGCSTTSASATRFAGWRRALAACACRSRTPTCRSTSRTTLATLVARGG